LELPLFSVYAPHALADCDSERDYSKPGIAMMLDEFPPALSPSFTAWEFPLLCGMTLIVIIKSQFGRSCLEEVAENR
jgi:hypothetical protein